MRRRTVFAISAESVNRLQHVAILDVGYRSGMRRSIIFPALFVFCCTTVRSPEPAPFTFHSNFWLNLHHFIRAVGRGVPAKANLTASEQQIWDVGVAFYRQHYSQRDLVHDEGMIAIKEALRKNGNAASLAGADIDAELKATLERVAPVYRAHWWPAHDATNREWIESALPLIRAHGAALSQRVAAAYGDTWFKEPVTVDLSIEAGANAAYTTEGPHATISSVDPGYRGLQALEMVFHEPSHHWGPILFEGIRNAAIAQKKTLPRQLWHAVLFYNAGELTRRTLAEKGIEYTEAAMPIYPDLCGSATCRDLVKKVWDRRLSGELSVSEALNQLVKEWPNG